MSDSELLQTMRRLLSIHDEIDAKKADLKTVYADAQSAGFDKAALGLAIREIRGREKARTEAAQSRSAIADLYVSTFDNAPRTYVHVGTRETTEHQPARTSAGRDPQSAQHGFDSEGGAGGEGPFLTSGSKQDSAEEPQARNEPGSEEAASGGEGGDALPETSAGADDGLDIPAFLDRRDRSERGALQ